MRRRARVDVVIVLEVMASRGCRGLAGLRDRCLLPRAGQGTRH